MRSRIQLVVPLAVALFAVVPAGAQEPPDRSDNVTVVGRLPFLGGTEIAFDGDIVFAGQQDGRTRRGELPDQGGMKVFDTSAGSLDLVADMHCPGNDNYVELVRPGILAMGHHTNKCHPRRTNGLFLIDVSTPSTPRIIPGSEVRITGGSHALTTHPSGDYIYASPGGLNNANGVEAIVDVRNPSAVTVAATFTPSRIGCHDVGFHHSLPFAYCAGAGEIQVWDVTNPLAPVTVGHIVNPLMQFAHDAVVSPDGTKLVINDEAFVVNECVTGQSPYGSLWIYDLSNPAIPLPAGRIAPPTSRSLISSDPGWEDSWCIAHNFGFVPGTDIVVSSWYTGGTTVHDISNPLLPHLLAFYKPSDTIAYTAEWHRGHIYVTDSNRGVEMLKVEGIAEG